MEIAQAGLISDLILYGANTAHTAETEKDNICEHVGICDGGANCPYAQLCPHSDFATLLN